MNNNAWAIQDTSVSGCGKWWTGDQRLFWSRAKKEAQRFDSKEAAEDTATANLLTVVKIVKV